MAIQNARSVSEPDEPHRLQPLLNPRSVAVIGASAREGSFGNYTLSELLVGGFKGVAYPINPNYKEILGQRCYPSLLDLPEAPDLAIFSIPSGGLEATLDQAIERGVRAAVMFANAQVPNDQAPPLTRRLAAKAKRAGILLCGANCMGFHNRAEGVRATWFPTPRAPLGNVAIVTHSGSAFTGLCSLDARFGFNVMVSSGQELVLTAADYMDYMLDMESTRALGLFLETVRDPAGFRACLERAQASDIPVIALKVGRTEKSAKLAITHSGALAGNDAAYEALFDHYGVHRTYDFDEFAAAASLLSAPRRFVQGGLGSLHDSGGLRGMCVDLAGDAGVRFAEISETTRAKLASVLEYGLDAVNPVDAWGTGQNADVIFGTCMRALAEDPDCGAVVLFSDIASDDMIAWTMVKALKETYDATDKLVVSALNWSRVTNTEPALDLIAHGIPMLDGANNMIRALRLAIDHRDFQALPPLVPPPAPPRETIERWRQRLDRPGALDEAESLALLADFGVPAPAHKIATTRDAAMAAAKAMGFPVALKTAAPGILHKSDVGGVRLDLGDEAAVAAAYDEMAARLGPRMLIARMAEPGTEVALGLVIDDQFGPLVMVAAGGILVELLGDRLFLLPPVDEARARRALDRLKIRKLFEGVRGRPKGDVGALARAVAGLASLAMHLGDRIGELDVNPVIVGPKGVVAVDALVVPRAK